MWFYTADTVNRVTSTRRPVPVPRAPREGVASHRAASMLRALADRLDTHPVGSPATDC